MIRSPLHIPMSVVIAFLALAHAPDAIAGAAPVATPATLAPAVAAETRQFDFLLGRWSIEVHPKVSGLVAMIHGTPKLVGSWEGKRSADGLGVEDELRIIDSSGNPISLSRCSRTWNAAEHRWRIHQTDVTRGSHSESNAQWTGNEMHSSGQYVDDGVHVMTRTRYDRIGPNGFRMTQDRSKDGGTTWDEGVLVIEAHRTAAAAR